MFEEIQDQSPVFWWGFGPFESSLTAPIACYGVIPSIVSRGLVACVWFCIPGLHAIASPRFTVARSTDSPQIGSRKLGRPEGGVGGFGLFLAMDEPQSRNSLLIPGSMLIEHMSCLRMKFRQNTCLLRR